MQVHTKKLPIDHVLVVGCPKERLDLVKVWLLGQGCVVDSADSDDDSVSFEEVFPDDSPGLRLRGLRYRENITQAQLAKLTKIPQRHISEMENNKRPIGGAIAQRIAEALNTNPGIFFMS